MCIDEPVGCACNEPGMQVKGVRSSGVAILPKKHSKVLFLKTTKH